MAKKLWDFSYLNQSLDRLLACANVAKSIQNYQNLLKDN
jgi:hypothetical protein